MVNCACHVLTVRHVCPASDYLCKFYYYFKGCLAINICFESVVSVRVLVRGWCTAITLA